MKRLASVLMLWILGWPLASPAAAATIYPMEAGNLRRYNQALSLTYAAAPFDIVWSTYTCNAVPRSNPIILTDRIIQAFDFGTYCLSRSDGKLIWKNSGFGEQWNPPAYDPDRDLLYQSSWSGSLIAIRPADGSIAWHYYEGMSQGAMNRASCTYWQGKIYLGTATQKVLCLDADTHNILWTLPIGNTQGIGTPALDNGEFYAGTVSGKLFRVDALSGAITWQINTPGDSYSSAISLDDTHLFVMTNLGKVECRLRSNGSLVWSYQTQSFTYANLSQGPLGLYASSDDRCVYRLDPNTGALLWHTCFAGNFARSAPFCVGNMVLASGCTGVFYGVDSGTGTGTWSLNHGADNSFTDFADADGLLFVCNRLGIMYCLRPQNSAWPATVTVSSTPSSTVTPTITVTPSTSSTATVTATATPSSSNTPSATKTPTSSSTATSTVTPTVTQTLTPVATASPTAVASPSPTDTPSPGPSPQLPAGGGNGGQRDPGPGQCYMAPNPIYGGPCRLYYDMRAPGTCRLRIYQASGDPVGEVVQHHDSAGLNSCEVSTQRYAPGVYFCHGNLSYDAGGKDDKLPLTKFLVLKAR